MKGFNQRIPRIKGRELECLNKVFQNLNQRIPRIKGREQHFIYVCFASTK